MIRGVIHDDVEGGGDKRKEGECGIGAFKMSRYDSQIAFIVVLVLYVVICRSVGGFVATAACRRRLKG